MKYPRTPHLPWSNIASDDIMGDDFMKLSDIVVTEKIDGECTVISNSNVHCRSEDSRNRSDSLNFAKQFASRFQHQLPNCMSIVGENIYKPHFIHYASEIKFFVHSIWMDNLMLSWPTTKTIAQSFGLELVPVLYEGPFDLTILKNLAATIEKTSDTEGYVIKHSDRAILYNEFSKNVFKYVRKDFTPMIR